MVDKIIIKKDKDGTKQVIEQANGVTVDILVEPSAEYINSMPKLTTDMTSRNLVSEIDDFKTQIDNLKATVEKLQTDIVKIKDNK